MLITVIEEDRMLEEQKQEMVLPGLINESLQCQCFLHGFEIDLDGNVIIPTLPKNHEAIDFDHK